MVNPPQTEQQLLQRAQSLAGLSLAEIAQQHSRKVPTDLKRDKGWVGQLLECALGTTASTKPEPDFQALGIELKALPVDSRGKPKESTFVSTIPLLNVGSLTWRTSYVYRKLKHVLWMPIQAEPSIPLAERCLGMPLLWQPSAEQEAALAQDWQELTDMISLGQLESITAHHGQYLQVRPKGANGRALCHGIGPDGSRILTLPRGFYLRPVFTAELLQQYYL